MAASLLLILPLVTIAQDDVGSLYTNEITLIVLDGGLGVRGQRDAAILASKLYMVDTILLDPSPQTCLLSNLIAMTNEQAKLSEIDLGLQKLDQQKRVRTVLFATLGASSAFWIAVSSWAFYMFNSR